VRYLLQRCVPGDRRNLVRRATGLGQSARAFLSSCVTQRSGRPAFAIFTAMKPRPKPFDVNGGPNAVSRIVPLSYGI